MTVIAAGGSIKTIRVVGLAATRYRIVDCATGVSVAIGPISTGITNTGTQRYMAEAQMPGKAGDYEIQWDDGSGAWAATEDLLIPNTANVAQTLQMKPPISG